MNNIKKLKKHLPDLKSSVPLKKYSTFRIGGPAQYFLKVESTEELILALKTAKEFQIPFYLIGGGSKLLISDKGFDGLVIKTDNKEVEVKKNKIFAGAGVLSNKVLQLALKESLTGAEWLAGIPGTIGGAINGNAAAFKGAIENIISKVTAYDVNKEQKVFFNNKKCQFDYRSSVFKNNHNLVILSCVIELEKGNKKDIQEKMEKYFTHRRKCHPLRYPSVGCIFKNPTVDSKKVPAWKVIADCGLDGKRVGDVKVSEEHSNFIINLGNGTAEDVEKLINLIKKKVKEELDINLEEEVQYL